MSLPYPACPVKGNYQHSDTLYLNDLNDEVKEFVETQDPTVLLRKPVACASCFERAGRKPGPEITWPPAKDITSSNR